MDQTLKALGGILLNALPTLFLVLLLHLYLKRVFFQPLEKVLNERREATEGARRSAEASLALATAKTAEYETAVRDARGKLYKEQEQLRRGLREDQAAAVRQARQEASERAAEARAQLAADVEVARRSLQAESEALAEQIAGQILRGRAQA